MKISVLYSKVKQGKITENNIAFYITDRNIISPDSVYDITTLGGQDAWHEVIEDSPDKKLFIYVFNTDSLIKYNSTQYSINDLVYLNKYLKRYEYTERQLIDDNWKINFNYKTPIN